MYENTTEQSMVSLFRDAYQPIRPLTLFWRDTEITITEIGYVQKLTEGKTVRHVFSCTDGLIFVELIFNEKYLHLLAEHLLEA